MELYQYFGEDLLLTQNSTLAMVGGEVESQQRILRRLLTRLNGYVFHTNYGAGIAQDVGKILTPALKRQIQGVIKSQILLEDTVSRTPFPEINLSQDGNNIYCEIKYTYKPSGEIYTLSFTVSE